VTGKKRWTRPLLLLLALILMLASAVYQRRTGPTHPKRGVLEAGESVVRYRLIRSEETTRDARVALPRSPGVTAGRVLYRRFKTDDPLTTLVMQPARGNNGREELEAFLPRQPAAGKLEYRLELETASGVVHIPGDQEGTIVIRFKDPVPLPLLVSHVVIMFFSMLAGLYVGLAALFSPKSIRRWAWTTLAGLTVGGMVLGPFVQKHAFGEYWTGFPWGYDLTDNKTLVMWLAWLVACAVLGLRERRIGASQRLAALLAAAVMIAVYLIPHSLRGSELDYSQVDRGVPAAEAIGTGD
jgi:hypothetical protein